MSHRQRHCDHSRCGATWLSALNRPRAQLDYYAIAGSAPMVYALGNRGADVPAELDGLHRGRIDWTWKNRSAGGTFLQLTLLTADVLVAAEAHRATMPIRRGRLDQTSILRKLMTYLAGGGANNAFGRHLDLGNSRVLFVTSSEARAADMIEALESTTGGAGSRQFLFTTRDALERANDLLDVNWASGKREIVRLGQ